VIGALTSLIAVPLSGPILTLGLLGSILGNVTPALAYPLNASNGFLVTILEWVAQTASAFPFAAVTTPGITPLLVGLFYLGCLPAALSETAFPWSGGRCGLPSSFSGRCSGSRSSASVAFR
jgi:competence protein ComEC